jgi:hypothetical protein
MNDEERLAHLNKKASEAALIRQMCETPGFKLLQSRFEEKIKKATNLIIDMNTSEDTVKQLRQKIHVWTELIGMLKSLILTGDCAARIINDSTDSDAQNTPTYSGQGE